MDLTLENLINQIQAGSLIKSAEDESEGKDEGKDEKSEKSDKDEKKENPFAKKEDSEEDSEEGDEDEGSEKKASDLGAEVAREVMSKLASLNLNTPQMNKQAQTAGQSLAQTLLANLRKQASAGDVTTTDGIAPGSPPSKTQQDVAQQNAEGASYIKPMPTGDGVRNGGTINQIFDGIVADSMAQGAASQEQVHSTGVSDAEGDVEDHAVPNQVKTASEMEDEMLKAAAVQALVDGGVDFSEAVDLVKQAEYELNDELEKAAAVDALTAEGIDFEDAVDLVKQAEWELNEDFEKSAALSELLDEGVDFEEAAEWVKQAAAGDLNTTDGVAPGSPPSKTQQDVLQQNAEGASYIKPMLTGDGVRNSGTINEIFDAIVEDAMSQGAASQEQVHTTGVADVEGNVEDHSVPNQVKSAAVNELVAEGYDFDTAVELVKEAGIGSRVKDAYGAAKGWVGGQAGHFRDTVEAARQGVSHGGMKRRHAFGGAAKELLSKNRLVQGGAALGAAGAAGGAYALTREKKAAFDALVEAGVDFEKAAELVAEKSFELYGE